MVVGGGKRRDAARLVSEARTRKTCRIVLGKRRLDNHDHLPSLDLYMGSHLVRQTLIRQYCITNTHCEARRPRGLLLSYKIVMVSF